MFQINKDTRIYASFSDNPGNNGCIYFNEKFQENKINAIYKSFYSSNIQKSIEAVKTLNIFGFAVGMPFKTEVLKYVDELDPVVETIGASNTVINQNGFLKAYNTDWLGVYKYLSNNLITSSLTILGNGGFSRATQYACRKLNIKYNIIIRKNWNDLILTDGYIFNATPVEIENIRGTLIDARPFTKEGKEIAKYQAEEQYKLYIRNGNA